MELIWLTILKDNFFCDGYKYFLDIDCKFCKKIVGYSKFEVLARWGKRWAPYQNICLLDVHSPHDVALSLANQKRFGERKMVSECAALFTKYPSKRYMVLIWLFSLSPSNTYFKLWIAHHSFTTITMYTQDLYP